MRNVVVAVAQQRLRLYPDIDAYRRDLERFFRLAETKHARLLVFPPRTGLMVVPPLVGGFRSALLKKADVEQKRASSWWRRARSGVMRSTAKFLGADIARELEQVLRESPGTVWQKYVEIFAALAYEYKITVVAGSGFFPDMNDGVLRHIATVFGPDGDIIGQQAQVMVDEEDTRWVAPGRGWEALPTPIGRLGILFGEEVLYPEVGRVLAYHGAESLIVLGATRDEMVARLYYDGLKARVTDNQVFGALSCVVGVDPFRDEERPPFRGRSVIMAPHGLTPRGNGILVEAGSSTAEVLVTARWNFEALHAYWQSMPLRVRHRLPVKEAASVLAPLYKEGMTLEDAMRALPGLGPRALTREQEEVAEPSPALVSAVAPPEEAPTPTTEVTPPEATPAPEAEAPREQVEEASPTPEGEEIVAPREEAGERVPDVAPAEEVEALPSSSEPESEPEPAAEVVEETLPSAAEEQAGVSPEVLTPVESPPAPETEDEGTPTPVESPKEEVRADARAPETEQPLVEGSAQAPEPTEQGGIPEELWAAIKLELERAAATLRSLREPEVEEAPKPPVEAPRPSEEKVAAKPASAREGWFHRLIGQAAPSSHQEDDIF